MPCSFMHLFITVSCFVDLGLQRWHRRRAERSEGQTEGDQSNEEQNEKLNEKLSEEPPEETTNEQRATPSEKQEPTASK